MVNVTTYFRTINNSEVKEFSLDPGQYTIIWDTVIAVHRAEEPGAPIEGPQHWYVYEIYADQSKFSNEQKLDFAEHSAKQKIVIEVMIILLILIFISYNVIKRWKK